MKLHRFLALTIVHRRHKRLGFSRRGAYQRRNRVIVGLGYSASIIVMILLVAAALSYATLTRELPSIEKMETLLDTSRGSLLRPTRLYDRSGEHILSTFATSEHDRVFIKFDRFPKSLVDATLALTQPDIWDSPGFTVNGWRNSEAHPTLAQKLASDFLLEGEANSPLRALRERLLAAQLTAAYGQEQIIEWFLNSTDYGNHAYGAEAAAQLYFNKSVTELNLSESALLATIGTAPALNPFDAPQASEAGRVETIRILLSLDWITPSIASEAVNSNPMIAAKSVRQSVVGISSQYIDLLVHQLDSLFGVNLVERGGAIIFTSLDYNLQRQVDCILKSTADAGDNSSSAITSDDGSPCITSELLSTNNELVGFRPTSTGVVIIDTTTGQILAAAGDLSPQMAGTSISPFIYLTGFARGLNPASLGWDLPGDEPALGRSFQGPVRLRAALANDYLLPAGTIISQMGGLSISSTTASFGLEIPTEGILENDFALSPLDLVFAYATLASQGVQYGHYVTANTASSDQPLIDTNLKPATMVKVFNNNGSLLLDWSIPQTRLVLSPQLSYLVNHVLSDETARWPSLGHPNPLEIGKPVAVKAAHSLDEQIAWVIGYSPSRAILVYSNSASKNNRIFTHELWGALAQHTLQDQPSDGWGLPAGIVTMNVCDPSGLLPTEACPNVVGEVFLEGRQPVQADTLFKAFEINIETGLLATVFTPPNLIKQKVFMVLPKGAQSWGETAGIDSPPSTYDTYQKPVVLSDAHITSPAMFSNCRGELQILGSASGDEFISYRLEYGMGLNPKRWVLIEEDQLVPVNEGLLAKWDTGDLNGLFTIRLLVVQSDNRVQIALSQITLDNAPPDLTLLYPSSLEEISLAQQPQVYFQAQVQEPFLDEIIFLLDGKKLGSVNEYPYGIIWQAKTGDHLLQVTATDLAGNKTDIQLNFAVKE